jgi:hypothetical protein
MWVVIIQSRKHAEHVWACMKVKWHYSTDHMVTFDRIEEARERRAEIERKWPHLRAFVFEIPVTNESTQTH